MEEKTRPKVPVHISLSERQLTLMGREAKRQQITMPELVRRIIDDYIRVERLEPPRLVG
jgi:hypothetical protein